MSFFVGGCVNLVICLICCDSTPLPQATVAEADLNKITSPPQHIIILYYIVSFCFLAIQHRYLLLMGVLGGFMCLILWKWKKRVFWWINMLISFFIKYCKIFPFIFWTLDFCFYAYQEVLLVMYIGKIACHLLANLSLHSCEYCYSSNFCWRTLVARVQKLAECWGLGTSWKWTH